MESLEEKTQIYIKNLMGWLACGCGWDKYDVVVSACLVSDNVFDRVKERFKKVCELGVLSFNRIYEKHPVNITFNHTVETVVKDKGEYQGYLYVDSGSIPTLTNIIDEMMHLIKSGKYGMITAQPSTDTEYFSGLGIGRHRGDDTYAKEIMFKDGNYIIPVGKGMGTHVNLVSNKLRKFYGRCYPDIFASHCTESTFSFMNAALRLQWIIMKNQTVDHIVSVDGQSSGFSPMDHVMGGGQTYDHPYRINSILDRVCTQEAWLLGMGYEECRGIMMHRPEEFDENQFCKNDWLKHKIKDILFLKKDELDYDNIKHSYES